MNHEQHARDLTDAELQAAISAYQTEQQRRESIPPEQRPDPHVLARLKRRHKTLYEN